MVTIITSQSPSDHESCIIIIRIEVAKQRQKKNDLFYTWLFKLLMKYQLPIQWVPSAVSLGVKLPEREADHSPPSSAEVKIAWGHTSTPPIRLHGVVLS
jgi:hypothetical protein